MIRKLTRPLTALALLGAALPALAVPARPGGIQYTQPDGTAVTLSLRGDEFFHYFQDEQGYIVEQQQDGWYRILDNSGVATNLVPMDLSRRNSAEQAELKAINPEQTFMSLKSKALASPRARMMAKAKSMRRAGTVSPAKWDNSDGHDLREIPTDGERHVLVILVNYSDLKWSFADDPKAEMTAALNEPGYSRNHFTGSAADYFRESSNDIYKPKFDVYGPVELGKPYAYYGRNTDGSDGRPWEMVSDACALLDPEVDFSIYDTNDDGIVDNVYVFYAGYGENEGAGANYVWPHSFYLRTVMTTPVYDGVAIDHYACSNELTVRPIGDDTKSLSGIGTFCHEFSHVLGLPDLYATDYAPAFTPGEFALMDHGSYNNNSRTPPLYSIYEKYALEWEKPIDITEGAEINMQPTVDGGVAYRITIDPANPKEYFLFENRQQHSWDEFIPGHGMLVWHIDFDKSIWDANVVNNEPGNQRVDIVEADGAQDDGSRTSDPFPGASARSEFTANDDVEVRKFANKNGKPTPLPITNIGEDVTGTISMTVGDGGTQDSPLYIASPKAVLTDVDNTSLSFKWDEVPGADKYYITVLSMYMDDLFYSLETSFVDKYTFADLGKATEITLTDLQPGMSYQVSVYASSENNLSSANQGFYSTFSSEMSDVIPMLSVQPGDTYAHLNWYEVPGAKSYEATVATREEGTPELGASVAWNNRRYPSDWSFPGGVFDSNEGFFGESAPSLRLNPGTAVTTGVYPQDISSISFWARTNIENGLMSLKVYAVEPNFSLTQIGEVTSVPSSTEGTQVEIKDLPAGVRQLMLVYNCRTAGLTMNMDDINIYYAGEVKDTPVAGYDAYQVSGTTLKAEGLKSLTNYVAYLRSVAEDGTKSAYSKTVKFSTTDPASVETVEDGSLTFAGGVVSSTKPMSIYAIDGTPVAVNVLGSVQLPARGIYIVATQGRTYKIAH